MGGDFNLLRSSKEKNKNLHVNCNYDTFNSIVNTCELRGMNMDGGNFTWSNNHEEPTLEKLDRLLMCGGWESCSPWLLCIKLP